VTAPEGYLGIQPEYYIAYAPHGPGLQCAIVYFVQRQFPVVEHVVQELQIVEGGTGRGRHIAPAVVPRILI